MRPHFLRTYRQAAQQLPERPPRKPADVWAILVLEFWPVALLAVIAAVSWVAQ